MSILTPRDVPLGGLRAMTVRRTLPNRQRSTIGAWCFVDHYGPDEVELSGGMKRRIGLARTLILKPEIGSPSKVSRPMGTTSALAPKPCTA